MLHNSIFPPFDQALLTLSIERPDPSLSNLMKTMEEKIENVEAERAQITPEWWSEWLALNRPKSENTKSHGLGGDENVADGTRPPPKDLNNLKVD